MEEHRFSCVKHAKPALVDNAQELPERAIAVSLQNEGLIGLRVQWTGRWAARCRAPYGATPDVALQPAADLITGPGMSNPSGEDCVYLCQESNVHYKH